MSPTQPDTHAGREAFTLPLVFLSVSLLSAVRVGEGVRCASWVPRCSRWCSQ